MTNWDTGNFTSDLHLSSEAILAVAPHYGSLKMLAAQRDDTGGKVICFLQIFLFIGLDHQLMHDHDITVGQGLRGLQAKFPHRASALVDFDESAGAWDAVDTIVYGWAYYFQVSKLDQLLVLVL